MYVRAKDKIGNLYQNKETKSFKAAAAAKGLCILYFTSAAETLKSRMNEYNSWNWWNMKSFH